MPRSDYEERREARIDRLQQRAERMARESERLYETGSKAMAMIPFGQPILVGHHSERRDRNYRRRNVNKIEKSFDLDKQAKDLAYRAASAQSNTAISGDDPKAVVKVKKKIADAEAERDKHKAINKIVRRKPKNKVTGDKMIDLTGKLGLSQSLARKLFDADFAGRVGIPSYVITNATANIRRMKERLKELEEEFAAADEGDVVYEIDVANDRVTVTEDVEENRLKLKFPGKPSEAVRKTLKSNGFRWSRYNAVWQRQLNANARGVIQYLVSSYGPEDWSPVEDASAS